MDINLPDSVDNAVKNLTDEPTKGIGTTLSDAWFLVFGGITQAAQKRRMRYSFELEQYNRELQGSVSNIPPEKLIEPDIQITAQALENSKYCIESKELRKLFVNLISNSMNSDCTNIVHPSFAEIIKQMSPLDARILKSLNPGENFPLVDYVVETVNDHSYETLLSNAFIPSFEEIELVNASASISSLNRLGIVSFVTGSFITNDDLYAPYRKTEFFQKLSAEILRYKPGQKATFHKYLGHFTPLGMNFFEACVK